jgi:putative transposase
VKPPNGYRPATREAAWLHQQGAKRHEHAGREWANSVLDNYQVIAAEGLSVRFLAKSTMACMSADAAMGAATRELIERGTRTGRTTLLVSPAHPTLTRSRCCARQARLERSERTFGCPNCGFTTRCDPDAGRLILATAEPIGAGVAHGRHLLPPLGVSSMLS